MTDCAILSYSNCHKIFGKHLLVYINSDYNYKLASYTMSRLYFICNGCCSMCELLRFNYDTSLKNEVENLDIGKMTVISEQCKLRSTYLQIYIGHDLVGAQ